MATHRLFCKLHFFNRESVTNRVMLHCITVFEVANCKENSVQLNVLSIISARILQSSR